MPMGERPVVCIQGNQVWWRARVIRRSSGHQPLHGGCVHLQDMGAWVTMIQRTDARKKEIEVRSAHPLLISLQLDGLSLSLPPPCREPGPAVPHRAHSHTDTHSTIYSSHLPLYGATAADGFTARNRRCTETA
jgi:hypothetical protein